MEVEQPEPIDSGAPEAEEIQATIDDPELADWFKVDKATEERVQSALKDEGDSDTDPDSDYEEIRFEEENADEWTPSQTTTLDEVDNSQADGQAEEVGFLPSLYFKGMLLNSYTPGWGRDYGRR